MHCAAVDSYPVELILLRLPEGPFPRLHWHRIGKLNVRKLHDKALIRKMRIMQQGSTGRSYGAQALSMVIVVICGTGRCTYQTQLA